MKEQSELAINIITSVIFICAYFIGLYFHIQIIRVSKKDKDITWKLDIVNSSLLIAHFTHSILMHGIAYFEPNLYTYTGEWFCYLSKFLTYYGILHIMAHSFIVSTMKYIVIVHWKKARALGHDKVQQIFFWIDLLFYPILMILIHLLSRPDFIWAYDGFAQIDRCLGDPKNNWGINTNTTQTKLHSLCYLKAPASTNFIEYTIYVLRSGICWAQVVVIYLVCWNLFEMVIYCQIFSSMRR